MIEFLCSNEGMSGCCCCWRTQENIERIWSPAVLTAQCLQIAGLREERSHSPGVRRFLQRVPAVSGSRPRHRCDDMVLVIIVIILLAVQCSGQQLTGLPPPGPTQHTATAAADCQSTAGHKQRSLHQTPDTTQRGIITYLETVFGCAD